MSLTHVDRNTPRRSIILLPVLLGAVLFTVLAFAQRGRGLGSPADDPAQSTSHSDIAQAKADREQSIKDAARLAQLAVEVKQELENGGDFTLSVGTFKKAEEMEKLSKKLHDRLKADRESAPKPGKR